MNKLSAKHKLKSLFYVTIAGCSAFSAICIKKGDEKFYKYVVMPVVHLLDPERAHNLAIFLSSNRLIPKSQFKDPDILKVSVFGKEFSNPVGIAAGFDKDGKAILGLQDIGFGFVEIGSVTPEPQPGNPKPRVFRLNEDFAVINRYGFNSEGHEKVLKRVQNVKQSHKPEIVGVNLGKNKLSFDAINDYTEGVKKFGDVADYLVINISSPNTPGLRSMQNKQNLRELLNAIIKTRNSLSKKPPLLLKLAPDLSSQEQKDIAEVLNEKDCRVDGLILSNTTVKRPDSLKSEWKGEIGGLSGSPLKDVSTKMIKDMSKMTNLPIIGVGGISSGKDAYEKIKAGATLVQVYSSLIYEGPPLVSRIKRELVELLQQDGYSNISQAVGSKSE